MVVGNDNDERIRRVLIDAAGYDEELVERDYSFAYRKTVPLAAFAYRPLDARSVCLGVVTSDTSNPEVSDYRGLGAPLLLLESENNFDLWRVGPNVERDERVADALSIDGIRRYFSERKDRLRPRRIYEAKTVARIVQSTEQKNLFSNYVDPDLLPFVEKESGKQLTTTVIDAIRKLVAEFGPEEWVIKVVFRLLAGKILRDKNVQGFKSVTLSHVAEILQKVERHYGSRDPLSVNKKKVSILKEVMAEFYKLGDLRNLTAESLGDVYEQALITKDIRKIHGTHKTPSYLVDYVVWQLADWIKEIPADELRFFEPGCGHAPFLVSLMRILRTLNIDDPNLSQFFRERFHGVDNDDFALEIARLSLTLADEPNPDGWRGLTEADMYADGYLEREAAQSTVMLTNPPFETRKAEELLLRTLPNLPRGAIFGAVVPATLLFSDKIRTMELRKWMADNCQLAEIDLFPDGLFTFGDHECAVLIGRVLKKGTSATAIQSRLRRVRDNDAARNAFQLDYRFSTTRISPQAVFDKIDDHALWIAEFQNEIWTYLQNYKQLSSIADVNQGLQHKGKGRPKGSRTVEGHHFPGSRLGFASSAGNWMLHEHPPMKYFNLAEEVIRRPGTGVDCLPQVLLNYATAGRGPWRLKPFIDWKGRPFTSRFLSVRPHGNTELTFLLALLMSPLANLFASTHLLKRDITKGIFERFPVPNVDRLTQGRMSTITKDYLELASRGNFNILNSEGFTEKDLTDLICTLDAEVLRLYALPARAERLLLEQFRGEKRPGIPVPFTEYYPTNTPDLPLYAYRSDSFQRSLGGNSPELPEKDLARYESLTANAERSELSKRDWDELYMLQAEVDGRDYAIEYANKLPTVIESTVPDEFEQRLRALSDRAVSASLKRRQE